MHARRICAAWYEIGISPRARSWPVGFFDRLHRLRAWNRLSGGLEIKILDGGSRGLLLLLFFFSCAKLLYVSLFRPTGWFAVLTLKERRYLFLKNCWPVSRTRFSLSTNTTIKKDSSTSTCSARVGARPSATTCDGEQVKHLVILWGYLHDSGMTFIQEWVLIQNEVRIAFSWQNWCVPSLLEVFKMIRMGHRLRLHGLRFSFQDEVYFHFTWHQNEISYREDNFIQIEK